ncbi:MAG TPA: BamA/TamA family outer membrane protein [Polyangiaceae bacterium]|nr:BamA/TamA family outer membrane protein [Polyangiaceae bacterium]
MGHELRAQYEAGTRPGWLISCTQLSVIGVRLLPAGLRALRAFGLILVFALISVLSSAGCTKVPAGRSAVKSVEVSGNDLIDADDLYEKLATTSSPKFLGLFRGIVYEYSVFDRFVLERDLQRIERYYRAVGYYHARARAGRVFFDEPNKVRVDIRIEEGAPMLVGRVDVHGLEGLPEDSQKKILRQVRRQICGKGGCLAREDSRPFEEERFLKAAQTLEHAVGDEGYAYATVQRAADVDLPKNRVAVGYFVKLGPKAKYGKVTIVGLGKIPEEPVRRALDLTEGNPYSRSELDLAERALLDLNVFSSVVITPALDARGASQENPSIPIKVTVEPSKLKAIHVGGGVQIDSLQSDLHLVGGWEHRNFFGGLRSISFEVKPGVVLYPTRIPTFETPRNLLPKLRLNAQFRQPGFIEPRTGFFTRLEGSRAPVIYPSTEASDEVLGYDDARIGAGLDRSFNSLHLYGSISHTVQYDRPFMYLGTLDPDLHPVVISYPKLLLALDLRDQQIHPHEGAYIGSDLQFAGVGGSAIDVKTTSEVRGYLPISRKWTLAARVNVGLLFAQNYGNTIEATSNGANYDDDPTVRPGWVRDIQLMFLRGFFAGGPGSNRGYALREIGPHGIVPQATSTLANTNCTQSRANPDCNLPLGGFTLWEASLELRFPISGAFSGAFFVDTADVSPKPVNFRLNRPHLSVGIGFRYDTPVGPIRLDAGYRVPGLQAPAGASGEGIPKTTFGVPMALSFGIGEAF